MNNYKFEELTIGLKESFKVTVDEKMMNDFLSISGDINPLHNDRDFALTQGYQDKVVYGLLTSSFISKLVGVYLPGKYCLLQGIEIKYLNPVYLNDELLIEGVVKELHESVKRAVLKVTITNQNNQKVVKAKVDVGFLKY